MTKTQQNAQNILANLAIVKAAAEGKTIEKNVNGVWRPVIFGIFDDSPDSYRIKREPIVRWAVVRDDVVLVRTYSNELVANESLALHRQNTPGSMYRVVELREVMKE